MSLYKAKGIIIKSIKLNEADKIIAIYSDSGRKINGVAKGLRKTKSRFGSRLEQFNYVQLLLYRGRNLDTITQVEIISPFLGIRKDLDKIAYASAMLDLVDKVAQEGEQGESQSFYLLLKSFDVLDKAERNFKLLLVAFDIKFMAISGYLPKLDSCVVCEKEISSEKVTFSSQWGGVVCEKCVSADHMTFPTSAEAIAVLARILNSEMEKIAGFKIDDNLLNEISKLTEQYLEYYLQTKLKSRDYLSQIEKVSETNLKNQS